MSLQGFQQAIVDLTLAPAMGRALRAGDARVLENYELTRRERDRLVAVAAERGMLVNCTLARGNRLEVIFEAFPMTCILLQGMLRPVLDELWESHRPSHYQLAAEADAFVVFISRKLADGTLDIEYLPEIFAYELACRGLTAQARSAP